MGKQFIQIVVDRPADGVLLGDDGENRAFFQHIADRVRRLLRVGSRGAEEAHHRIGIRSGLG